MNRLLLLATVILAQAIPTTAESREKDLDRWVERDLIPHVRQQLLVHPRFTGETVMFVVLKDKVPTPVTNALAISLRDRLLEAAINTPGVAVGWQQGRRLPAAGNPALECERDEVHYYIGLELVQELDSSYSVAVRALDLEDRSWVAGFGRKWNGQLRTIHRQAMRQSRIDATFRGSRDVPFSLAETDLLATQLAHDLSCTLLRQASERYVVEPAVAGRAVHKLDTTVELVGNNLARSNVIELAGESSRSNAVLQGKAHRIDGPLYQYWLTVTPTADDAGLSTLSTSAYIVLPETAPVGDAPGLARPAPQAAVARSAATAAVSIPNDADAALLGPLRITAPSQLADCGPRGASHRQNYLRAGSACSVLESEPRADAIVFFLAYQTNQGLVRLGDTACRARTIARIASPGQSVRFPIPRVVSAERSNEAVTWLVEPEVDTYYAVALSDARSARSIANHIDRLPLRCAEAVRPGLEGPALRDWLDEFAMLAARSATAFDWRALEVREIL